MTYRISNASVSARIWSLQRSLSE